MYLYVPSVPTYYLYVRGNEVGVSVFHFRGMLENGGNNWELGTNWNLAARVLRVVG